MRIEEKVLRDLKIAVNAKDQNKVDMLRNIYALISSCKSKYFHKYFHDALSDKDISDYIMSSADTMTKAFFEKYCAVKDNEKILAEMYVDEIISKIKSVYPVEEFFESMLQIASEKDKINKN